VTVKTGEAFRADGLSRRRLGWGVTAELARLLPSLVTFAIVPRALGPAKYGQLAALLALLALVASLATTGAHIVYIRSVTQGAATARATGKAFATSLLGGVVALALAAPIANAVFDRVGVLPIVLLFVAELIFGNLLHVFSGLALAREDQRTLAVIVGLLAAARVVATVAYACSPLRGSVTGFAWSYLAAVVASTVAWFFVVRARGVWTGARFVLPGRSDVTGGLAISSTAAAFYVQDGLDTPIIVRSGYDADAGMYASAYRVASLAFAPINAMVLMGLPRLVPTRRRSLADTRRTAMRMTAVGMAYGAITALLMLVAAPLLPAVVGPKYEPAADILRWLALLPLLRASQYFVANHLMLSGRQHRRLVVQLVSAIASVAAYLLLIPSFSWRGAVAGTYVSEVVLAAGLWIVFAQGEQRRESLEEESLDALVA
jgi:O-antigen/teichoic acid export membrane protein